MMNASRHSLERVFAACALVAAVMAAGCGGSGNGGPPATPAENAGGSEKGYKGVVVEIFDGSQKADPWHSKMHMSDKTDHIRWDNKSTTDVTITFESGDVPLLNWPSGGVLVRHGEQSEWFTLRKTPSTIPPNGISHKTKVTPHPTGWGGGPDDPDITEDP